MSQAPASAMATVIKYPIDKPQAILTEKSLTRIDIANYNAPSQLVIG
jgi:hypothetical protein